MAALARERRQGEAVHGTPEGPAVEMAAKAEFPRATGDRIEAMLACRRRSGSDPVAAGSTPLVGCSSTA